MALILLWLFYFRLIAGNELKSEKFMKLECVLSGFGNLKSRSSLTSGLTSGITRNEFWISFNLRILSVRKKNRSRSSLFLAPTGNFRFCMVTSGFICSLTLNYQFGMSWDSFRLDWGLAGLTTFHFRSYLETALPILSLIAATRCLLISTNQSVAIGDSLGCSECLPRDSWE